MENEMTNDAAVAWYYEFGDTGEAGPVTFGGDPGREAIEWAERYGHTLHYLVPATTVAELRAEIADRDAVIECKNIDIRERDRALKAASKRADAAERRVAELKSALMDVLRPGGMADKAVVHSDGAMQDEMLALLRRISALTKESP